MSSPIDPRYPIGKYLAKESYSPSEVTSFIERIRTVPQRLELALQGLSATQLDSPYRDGGWTVGQVVHHVADSHMNAYIRVKWTLTEDTPVIKPYDEKGWAETTEMSADPALSLALVKALHAKWVVLLAGLTEADMNRDFFHPATKKNVRLAQVIGMYAWHGDHHIGHITALRERMNW
ncbi:MAG: bacillithiol transferase BstA [Cytophagales bacterium]|nr:bacillithiol transferase BstA [Cytophagales bacterium]